MSEKDKKQGLSPEAKKAKREYMNKLDDIIGKFRGAKVPMNRTSLQKFCVEFAVKDELSKTELIKYIIEQRTLAKIEL